jgi:uncharacterized phage protein gp47/JayE
VPATIDENGITIPTQAEIKAEIDSDLKGEFGASLDTETGFLGRFNALMAEKLRKAYELLLETYQNAFADSAIAEPLAALAAMTGTIRRQATASQVPCTVQLDDGTYLAGTLVAYVYGDESALFENRDDVAVTGGANPETVTGVVFIAQSTGPTVANAGTLTETQTVVTGWSDNTTPITNPADATIGSVIESEEDLRDRRVVELSRAGSGTASAVRSDVSAVDGVSQVIVLENETDAIDVDGLLPHSLEVIVYDGTDASATSHVVDDDDIAQAIWDSKPGGTYMNGDESGTATDDNEDTHTVQFTRPTKITVYVEVDLTKDPDTYGGDAAVASAIASLAQATLEMGSDVYASLLYGARATSSRSGVGVHGVDGVVEVTRLEVSVTSPTSGSVDVGIGYREIASINTGNIAITSSDA